MKEKNYRERAKKVKNTKRVKRKKWQYEEKKRHMEKNSDKKLKEDKKIKENNEKFVKQTKENAKKIPFRTEIGYSII